MLWEVATGREVTGVVGQSGARGLSGIGEIGRGRTSPHSTQGMCQLYLRILNICCLIRACFLFFSFSSFDTSFVTLHQRYGVFYQFRKKITVNLYITCNASLVNFFRLTRRTVPPDRPGPRSRVHDDRLKKNKIVDSRAICRGGVFTVFT